MKRVLIFLMFVFCAFTVYSFDSDLAKKEGVANLYANITAIEPLMEKFSKDTGVKGVYTRISTSKYLATVLTEYSAGKLQADVVQGPLPILQTLKDKGVLKKYDKSFMAGYPEWAKADDYIAIFGIEYVAIIFNKDLVKGKDIPKSYMDLTDIKWKNKIVMPDPASHATTISWLVGLKENKIFKSDAEWMDFLQKLAANKPMFVKSFSPTPAPIESGEKFLGISMPKYIITKAPAPLDWARTDTLLGSPRGIALVEKSARPNAGSMFLKYWLSNANMQALSDKVGEYVLAKGVFPPIEGIDKVKVIPIRELSDEEIKKWGAEFKKIFYSN